MSDFEHPAVLAAAQAVCQARCALRDRDPGCQEAGRCGTNWKLLVPAVVAMMDYPVLAIPSMLRAAAQRR